MKKAIAGFILGLACLFLFSLTWGSKVFSDWERRLSTESRTEKKFSPEQMSLSEKESWGKKIRLSMNSFDLANGLTFQELENIPGEPGYRFSAFLSLVAALWLVALLRKPGSHQI